MAFCRGRLFFETRAEQRSQDSGIIQVLNFKNTDMDSDNDGDCCDGAAADGLRMPGSSPFHRGDTTPDVDSSFLWDSGLCSPTPKSCQLGDRRSPRRENMSPVPFSLYDSDDADGDGGNPPLDNSFTPPHKKLRSLRLYDTPHTPKSLLQKAQRRITRLQRTKTPISSRDSSTSGRPPSCLESRANVNPFTPVAENHHNGSAAQTGVKRSRMDSDW